VDFQDYHFDRLPEPVATSLGLLPDPPVRGVSLADLANPLQ
jgi:hypothetical protein